MSTMQDVARLAGVSVMTVSNVLHRKPSVREETARKVLDAARQLNYRPNVAARQLRRSATHVIGLTIVDFDLMFPTDVAACISDQAYRQGYQTIVQQTRYDLEYERRALDNATAQICDGLILCWPHLDVSDLNDASRRMPIVAFDGFKLDGHVDCVLTPSEEGSRDAVAHMIRHGCRKILLLGCGWLMERPPVNSRVRRFNGAVRALQDAGLPCEPDMACECEWTRRAGYETVSRLIKESPIPFEQRFDGIFCLCDPIAIGSMKALTDHGLRIPEDVAVMGFDATEDGDYLTPRLSSVTVESRQAASMLLTLLLERVVNRAPSTRGQQSGGSHPVLEPRTRILDYRIMAKGSGERHP